MRGGIVLVCCYMTIDTYVLYNTDRRGLCAVRLWNHR